MKVMILVFSLIALCLLVMNTTDGISGDVMKCVGIISICCMIGFVWVN